MPSITTQRYLELRRYSIVFFKYILTTATSLLIASRFAPMDLLSCAFVAVLTLQPNLYRGLLFSWDQLKATTLAAVLSTIIIYVLQVNVGENVSILAASISMGFTIVACIRLKMEDSAVIALFTVVYLMVLPEVFGESYWGMLHMRYLTILIGIGTASVFNFLTSLLRYKDRLHLNLIKNTKLLAGHLTAVKELLRENREIKDEQLNRQLEQFGEVFASLRASKQDLNEIEKEMTFIKGYSKKLREKENYFQQGLLYALNDISHYGWDVVLNLLDLERKGEIMKKTSKTLNVVSRQLRKLNQDLKRMRVPSKGNFKKRQNDRLQELYSMLEEYASGRGEESLTFVTLLSDLVHLELTTMQFRNLVARYAAVHTSGTEVDY